DRVLHRARRGRRRAQPPTGGALRQVSRHGGATTASPRGGGGGLYAPLGVHHRSLPARVPRRKGSRTRLSRPPFLLYGSAVMEDRGMTYETVQVSHREGVSVLTLNRPPVNAVSPALMRDVLAALDDLEAREGTRCIVLTGSGTK